MCRDIGWSRDRLLGSIMLSIIINVENRARGIAGSSIVV